MSCSKRNTREIHVSRVHSIYTWDTILSPSSRIYCYIIYVIAIICGMVGRGYKPQPMHIRNIFPSWWRHQMETFSALLAICAGIHRSPVNSLHKGQWRRALMFSFICVWINGWENNREAGDLRRYHAHYDVIVMIILYKVDALMWFVLFYFVLFWYRSVNLHVDRAGFYNVSLHLEMRLGMCENIHLVQTPLC